MKELVVISGKGGTGKTSLTASLAALEGRQVLADCDVDAADLHLVLEPRIGERREFRSGHQAVIRQNECLHCGECRTLCRFEAVIEDFAGTDEPRYRIDPASCEGCGVCVRFCSAGAIDFPERICGEWYTSETRFGPMVHARLGIGAENSGRLVTTVRKEARRVAEERGIDRILVDGPPGIGCPVIASITGATLVLAVIEPSLTGRHDLDRVLDLTRHFHLPAAVCVNKWDVNPELTERIEAEAVARGAQCTGRIRYDRAVTAAQLTGRSVVEMEGSPSAEDIRSVWIELRGMMQDTKTYSEERK